MDPLVWLLVGPVWFLVILLLFVVVVMSVKEIGRHRRFYAWCKVHERTNKKCNDYVDSIDGWDDEAERLFQVANRAFHHVLETSSLTN